MDATLTLLHRQCGSLQLHALSENRKSARDDNATRPLRRTDRRRSNFPGKSASRTDSFGGEIEKSINAFAKFFRLHVIGVTAELRVTPGRVSRILLRLSQTTEFRKMFVANSVFA